MESDDPVDQVAAEQPQADPRRDGVELDGLREIRLKGKRAEVE